MVFYKIVKMVAKLIFYPVFRPKIYGRENIDDFNRGCLLICNHTRLRDPVLLAACCKPTLHFMAKVELFKNKLFGKFLEMIGVFSVNRGSADIKAIKKAINIVKSGEICAIFPEGHRNKGEGIAKFEDGVSFLALQCKAPVVPAAITWRPFPKRSIITFGEAIDLNEIIEGVERRDQVSVVTACLRDSMIDLSQRNAT